MGASGQMSPSAAGAQAAQHQPTRFPVWTVAGRRFLAGPSQPAAKALYAYWQSRRGPSGLPRRDDIIAAQIPRLLPHLAILEPAPGRHDWRVRLFGTSLAWRYDVDCTSKRVREIYAPLTAETLIETYDKAAREYCPIFIAGRAVSLAEENVGYEGVVLPILGRDAATVWVLTGTFFYK